MKITTYFLAAGFLIPSFLFLVIVIGNLEIVDFTGWGRVLVIVWPTVPFIMSAEAGGGAFGELLAFLMSAAANAVVYGLVGFLISFCYRRYYRSASSANDPVGT